MKKFTQGGQVTLHQYNMFGQVLRRIFFLALPLYCLFVAAFMYKHIYSGEWYMFAKYHYASFMHDVSSNYEEKISFIKPNGEQVFLTIRQILHGPSFLAVNEKVFNALIQGLLYGLFISIGFCALLVMYFQYKSKSFKKSKNYRGMEIAPFKKVSSQIFKDNRKKGGTDYSIAGLPYPKYSETFHTMISGGTGSGKTVIISDLVQQIKQRGDRAIIYDKMGNYLSHFYEPNTDILLNPLDQRHQQWGLFSEVKRESDFSLLAESLIPEEKMHSDPFWLKASRILLAEVANKLWVHNDLKIESLYSKLIVDDFKQLAEFVKGTPAHSIFDENSPKTASSIRAVLSSYLSSLKYLEHNEEEQEFSIHDWVSNKESGFLFLTSREDQHSSLKPLISTWINLAISELLSQPQTREKKLWFILDELPTLHYIPSLKSGLAQSRQFGGAFILGLQAISDLRSIYGHDIAQTLSSLCETRVSLRTPDPETAEWASKSLGQREYEEVKESISYGANSLRDGNAMNTQKYISELVLPSEIMSLPSLNGYLRPAEAYPITKFQVKYKHRETLSERYIEKEQKQEDIKSSEKIKIKV